MLFDYKRYHFVYVWSKCNEKILSKWQKTMYWFYCVIYRNGNSNANAKANGKHSVWINETKIICIHKRSRQTNINDIPSFVRFSILAFSKSVCVVIAFADYLETKFMWNSYVNSKWWKKSHLWHTFAYSKWKDLRQ